MKEKKTQLTRRQILMLAKKYQLMPTLYEMSKTLKGINSNMCVLDALGKITGRVDKPVTTIIDILRAQRKMYQHLREINRKYGNAKRNSNSP